MAATQGRQWAPVVGAMLMQEVRGQWDYRMGSMEKREADNPDDASV